MLIPPERFPPRVLKGPQIPVKPAPKKIPGPQNKPILCPIGIPSAVKVRKGINQFVNKPF